MMLMVARGVARGVVDVDLLLLRLRLLSPTVTRETAAKETQKEDKDLAETSLLLSGCCEGCCCCCRRFLLPLSL